mmetsp:Transcript_33941/g.44781  ORF Transcript_33941/g.44781 Transcript_33941/m.44781 type:complete len:204 (+) Transcript_33941:80-691(+)
MPTLKLIYFNIAARAEPIRHALYIGGIEFEDSRVSREEFSAMKPNLPSGQLPVLEVDGFPLSQSHAILRYAGKLAGLYPEDPLEAAKTDAIMGLIEDIHSKVGPTIREPDATKKMEMRAKLAEEILPLWFGFLQTTLEGCGDFFGGASANIADLMALQELKWISSGILDGIPTTILDGFPVLSAYLERMKALPKIVEYYESRS